MQLELKTLAESLKLIVPYLVVKWTVIFLLLLPSCKNHKELKSKKEINQSDTIVLSFVNQMGDPVYNGSVGLHFKDYEENSMDIIEKPNRMYQVNEKGIIKLNKKNVSEYYRINLSDSLTGFYYVKSTLLRYFVLHLNQDSLNVVLAEQ